MNAPAALVLNVQSIEPMLRHPTIFGTFDALPVGQALEIVNDHDPRPLLGQFQRTRPEQFHWQYLQAGPTRWHVRIGRVADGPVGGPGEGCGAGGCACAGAH